MARKTRSSSPAQAPTPWPERILDEISLARASQHLANQDGAFAKMAQAAGAAPLRRRESGLPGLVWMIVGQQISVAAANAIHARLLEKFSRDLDPSVLAEASDEDFQACGLSRAKTKTIRTLARSIASGDLDLEVLHRLSLEDSRARLRALHGVGPWTAELYLLFCLGAPDAFPSGDLALQEAARLALNLKTRPNAEALEKIAERWRPLRAVAARQLWAFYRHCKLREGVSL